MKKYLLICMVAVFNFCHAQFMTLQSELTHESKKSEKISVVSIHIEDHDDIHIIEHMDVGLDHIHLDDNGHLELYVNQKQLEKIKRFGFVVDVRIDDFHKFYQERAIADAARRDEVVRTERVASNFGYGSMGGFYTYDEVVAKLDEMKSQYGSIVKEKFSIGTTHEGRTIWAIKISDNPNIDEDEPAVHYDALHHAREPLSMAVTINYMFWLLENYATDPQVQYIINNRELYFVPVVNPDGYVYNQSTNPNGGGLWRKNRRNNGSNYGVDLNRNYSFGYNYDGNCSSTTSSSNTYSGPNAFSEPEAQAIRDFIAANDPTVAFSTHSTAGKYLMPYGYTTSPPAFESYSEWATDFLSDNNYPFGTTFQMLGYTSCGTTRDYMHSQGIYGWTPEIGGSGFWPAQSEIFGRVDENVYPLFYQAWISGDYADFQDYSITGDAVAGNTISMTVEVKNKGVGKTSNNVTVELVSNSPGVTVSAAQNIVSLANQARATSAPFTITIPESYADGSISMSVITKQDGVESNTESIDILIGTRTVLFSDDAENGAGSWTPSGNNIQWGVVTDDCSSGTKAFGDSDGSNCQNNTENYFICNNTFDLTSTSKPILEFDAKWSMEEDDRIELQVSSNGGTNYSAVATYTLNSKWARQKVDLSGFKNSNNVRFRFYLYADGDTNSDGYYFDDIALVDYNCPDCPVCDVAIDNYPNELNFESGLSEWSQGSGDDIDWTVNTGGTPSNATGPDAAQEGTKYAYIEASNPNNPSKVAYLVSPCYDIRSAATASISFQYHMKGTTNFKLDLEVSTDGGQSWSNIFTKTGNQSDQWIAETVDLAAQIGQMINLRFKGTTGSEGNAWQGDVAIDAVSVNAEEPTCTPGTTCDDGDVCTTGETYDSNCNCTGGTVNDADNDGVCDANDQCPDFNDALIGTACDDGDPCTIGDIYNSNCNCAGTYSGDSDNDGVCNAQDQCPDFNDALIGTACDDGDACTDNDVYTTDCNCAGTPNADSDNDGVCDANDQCPGFDDALIGTACDDGNACTTGETWQTDCNCGGGVVQDSDNDGVCDAEDQCPDFNDALIGTPCDDGNACTLNDTYVNCNCQGEAAPDADNDGVCDAQDQCPDFNDALIGTACDDGDPCTTGETYQTDCGCSGGTLADSDNDGICDATDACPNDPLNICNLPSYCASQGTNIQYEWIQRVQLAEIDNNSGASGGYGDFTTIAANFTAGQTYSATLTPGFQGTAYSEHWAIWIDFNRDGDFDDTGEQVLTANSNAAITQNVTIPSNITPGSARMRISMQYNSAPPNCGSFTYGEVEDYTAIISLPCNVGAPCDDGNVCTTGETLDANCNCTGGTIQDADNDGVCDAEDQCPNFNDALIGTACDDGDVCTTGETYDANCGCSGGTIQDADNDGVCDAEDQCPNFNDALIGTACDDGNACTTGETYDTNCGCSGGTIQDADNDGVCDAEDQCPNFNDALIGTACDDGNACTTGETYDANCGCSGGTIQDSDNDGVCDAEDNCPNFDNNLIGQPCDDGNACTTGETYDANCGCSGGTIQDADNDGVCDAEDNCPNFDNNLIGQPCDDGDVCTTGETYDSNCGCTGGVIQDADTDGICDANDVCPGFNDVLLGQSCNDNDPCTINDIYVNCGCAGTPTGDADNDGVCDAQDQCPNFNDALIGTPCDDGDACTTGETYDANCGCSGGTFQDADNDGVCDANDQCPNFNDALIGTSCDDGSDCTINDVYVDCNCAGTPVGDADNDGVCDAEDSCPNLDNALIGTPCDDGNPCTTGETYDANCGCSGGVESLTSSLVIPDMVCANAVFEIATNVSGGQQPYSYVWNDGSTNPTLSISISTPTVFAVTISDVNGCQQVQTNVVGVNALPTASLEVTDQLCLPANIVAQVTAPEGSNYNYDWGNGSNVNDDTALIPAILPNGESSTAQITTVTVTDPTRGCSIVLSDTTIVQEELFAVITATPNTICSGESSTLSVMGDFQENGTYNYQWNNGQVGPSIIVSPAQTTLYTVTVFNDYCSTTTSIELVVSPDSDNDGVCDAEDQCPDFNDALIGTPCDDGDACTVGETYDANCGCSGGVVADADNDGVCDAEDQCPNFNDALIGTPCDDGDACTVGETYDANCGCSGGVVADADNDGVCDAEDQCPDFNDALIGTPCDDGDACTTGETYDANCGCSGGTVQDADNDGVCDAEDQCPDFNDALIGTACDDGDACTVGETYDANCGCSGGVVADSDNDGVCDANDQCPDFNDALIGTPCDDGDACTVGETYDSNCGCSGGVVADADNDGVCDAEDQCPNFNDALIGTPCDDGDACTVGETYDANCGCSGGVVADADNDGVCDAEDQCPDFNDALIGTPCDDGDACTTGETYDANCGCSGGTVQDADNDGVCDANDQCPEFNDALIGTPCDDGDACTVGETYDANCGCSGGVVADSDNDGVCDANDQCPDFNDALIGTPCDDGDACTVGETYDANCACSGGVIADADNDGVCDANDQCPDFNDALIGTPCDDGDACTVGETYGANCGCSGGVVADADNDGVCDANDQCPDFNDALIGTPCDDGDPCTVGETYDSNCGCSGGVVADADNDGVCDANDQCPDFNDALIGTPCDDGDACTVGETYDSNCGCSGGVVADADNDGVCDANDQCPDFNDALIGTPCDDGDPCTVGETYDSNCGCSGGVVADADNDGVCDANDQCPDFNDALIGTACDDGDACTVGETYDANCGCSGGVVADADNDGVCDAEDQCPDFNDALIGTPCDDGDACTVGETYDVNCGCSGGVVADADNDGVCDAEDQCPDFNDALIGTPCDDGDACTVGEIYDANCGCSGGVLADTDNDGVCDAEDQCPGSDDAMDINNDGYIDGCATCPFYNFNEYQVLSYDSGQDFGPSEIQDGGNTLYMTGNAWKAIEINYNVTANTVITFDFKSTNEGEIHEIGFDNDLIVAPNHRIVVYGNQGYNGDFSNEKYTSNGQWQSFAVDLGAQFTGEYKYLVLSADDDASAAGNSFYRNIQIFEDEDNNMACDIACTPGESCDDGDPCTINTVYDEDCNCSGGETLLDSDNDGVCDEQDVCQGFDDTLIGNPCDDGDACTVGETYDANCGCSGGVYTDADNDGYCVGEDPDDSNACVPDESSEACNDCTTIISDDFENGFGNWNDGGSDSYWYNGNANSGNRSIRLRDNSGLGSSMYTKVLDLSSYASIELAFTFLPNSMEAGEDFFFEYTTNNGASWTIIQQWRSGVEFFNGVRYFETLTADATSLNENTRFRFRCDASTNSDQIYIDDVVIEACYTPSAERSNSSKASTTRNEIQTTVERDMNLINMYPNPVIEKIYLDTKGMFDEEENLKVEFYTLVGQLVSTLEVEAQEIIELDLSELHRSQQYMIRVTDKDGESFTSQFLKID